jgi:HTH-type transcriptional regulator, global nitrogen regulator NrpRI
MLKDINPKQKVAILRVLRDAHEPIGSAIIAEELKNYGFELSGRSIRLYLQKMEEEGLVTSARRGRDGGRTITNMGQEEIHDALVTDRVGFLASKVDELAYQVTLDPEKRTGKIVLNLTLLSKHALSSAVKCMIPIFDAGMGMGEYVYIANEGEYVGDFMIPKDKVGIGTVCSVTFNGVLLSSGIPASSLFGGVLEIDNKTPIRFTDVIHYAGTSLDPLEIFIKGKLTSVRDVALTGHGRIGASFRDIPTTTLPQVKKIRQQMQDLKMDGILVMGKPHHSLLGFPVEEGRTAFIVTGGLNPTAAIEESGIHTSNHALCTMFDFENLIHYQDMEKTIERSAMAAVPTTFELP